MAVIRDLSEATTVVGMMERVGVLPEAAPLASEGTSSISVGATAGCVFHKTTKRDVILYIKRYRNRQASYFCDTLSQTLPHIFNPPPTPCTVADFSKDYLEARKNLRNAEDKEDIQFFRIPCLQLKNEM